MSDKLFYAHSLEDQPPNKWQMLKDHLAQTAQQASDFATVFEAGDWAYLVGLWHDVGKYSEEFQKMLRASVEAQIEHISRIDHSTFGAQQVNRKWPKGEGKLLAYIIAGHHAGLPNGKSNRDSSLLKRLEKDLPYSFNCPEDLLNQSKPSLPFEPEKQRAGFEISFLIRMLYSSLVDADFLDTERFIEPQRSALRPHAYSLCELEKRLSHHLNNLKNVAQNTPVNQIRSQILHDCLQTADQPHPDLGRKP